MVPAGYSVFCRKVVDILFILCCIMVDQILPLNIDLVNFYACYFRLPIFILFFFDNPHISNFYSIIWLVIFNYIYLFSGSMVYRQNAQNLENSNILFAYRVANRSFGLWILLKGLNRGAEVQIFTYFCSRKTCADF